MQTAGASDDPGCVGVKKQNWALGGRQQEPAEAEEEGSREQKADSQVGEV